MKVTIRFTGMLTQYTGRELTTYELPDGSRYQALMEAIGREYGQRLPSFHWDKDHRTLLRVSALGKGRDLRSPDEPLIDGEEVVLIVLALGG